jgi:hypothetical protein
MNLGDAALENLSQQSSFTFVGTELLYALSTVAPRAKSGVTKKGTLQAQSAADEGKSRHIRAAAAM